MAGRVDGLRVTNSEGVGLIVRRLVSKISNLCDHNPPTLQTDDMRSQYRTLHYSASRGKNTEKDAKTFERRSSADASLISSYSAAVP